MGIAALHNRNPSLCQYLLQQLIYNVGMIHSGFPRGFTVLPPPPPDWAIPVHHIIFKHAPHLAIPAVIYLKHPPPRLGDAGSSYMFKHAPHLAFPAIIDLKHGPRLGDAGSSYIFKHAFRLS